jgi:hypothetical protein
VFASLSDWGVLIGAVAALFANLGDDLHGVGVYIVGAAAITAFLWLIRVIWKAGRTLTAIDRTVLPHFAPPSAAEIRDPAFTDNTLPGRVVRQEAALISHTRIEEATTRDLHDRVDAISVDLSAQIAAVAQKVDRNNATSRGVGAQVADTAVEVHKISDTQDQPAA